MKLLKKIVAVSLLISISVLMTACIEAGDTGSNNDDVQTTQNQTGLHKITRDEAESIATQALYNEVVSDYSGYNVEDTKYSIGSIEQEYDGGWTVKGKIYFYDKYGSAVSDYFPGTFDIDISSTGRVESCYISRS